MVQSLFVLITFSDHLKYLTRQGFTGLLDVMNLIICTLPKSLVKTLVKELL